MLTAGPFVSVPASELMIPQTPEQAYTEPTTEEAVSETAPEAPATSEPLPTIATGSVIKASCSCCLSRLFEMQHQQKSMSNKQSPSPECTLLFP